MIFLHARSSSSFLISDFDFEIQVVVGFTRARIVVLLMNCCNCLMFPMLVKGIFKLVVVVKCIFSPFRVYDIKLHDQPVGLLRKDSEEI